MTQEVIVILKIRYASNGGGKATKLQYVNKNKSPIIWWIFFYPKKKWKITEKENTLILELRNKQCDAY